MEFDIMLGKKLSFLLKKKEVKFFGGKHLCSGVR